MTLRESIVAEALSWILTPYRTGACVKGCGADCASFILGVFRALGMMHDEVLGSYASDVWAHTDDERLYLYRLRRYAKRMIESVGLPTIHPLPGDVVLTRGAGSKVYNHGGIVIAWPRIVHAVDPCVCWTNALTDPLWTCGDLAWFDLVKEEDTALVR